MSDEETLEEADGDADDAASARRPIGQGRPPCNEIAASALTSASTEPTDRSMPAVVMTKVMATATIISGAICRRMLRRLASVKNVLVSSEKTTTITTKKRRDAGDAAVVVDDHP